MGQKPRLKALGGTVRESAEEIDHTQHLAIPCMTAGSGKRQTAMAAVTQLSYGCNLLVLD
jgi:hypothetical protein